MKNEFATIDTNDLDTVNGGAGKLDAVRRAGAWAWKNIGAPIAGGAAWQAASDWLSGGSKPSQQPAQPSQPAK